MVGIVCTWKSKDPPESVKMFTLLYPIESHSFQIEYLAGQEQVIARDNIVGLQEYVDIFLNFGTVFYLGTDIQVHDWKTALIGVPKATTHPNIPDTVMLPENWYFNFQPSKRIIIKKSNNQIKVKGETDYNLILVSRKPFTSEESWNETTPNVIAKEVTSPRSCNTSRNFLSTTMDKIGK